MGASKIRRYNFAKPPKRASKLWLAIADVVAIRPTLRGFSLSIDKVNMDGLKPPYLLLASHASEMDFAVMYQATDPYRRMNPVCAIDAIRDNGDWLMRNLGCICKRKFIKDFNLIRHMRYCAKEYGDIVCMFPEARYTLDGCESYIPDSVGKLCKLLKIPVVTLNMEGNFIIGPQWNKTRQKLPLHATISQIVTAEELRNISVDEINKRIRDGLKRDDFRYQLQNNIHNTYAKRAEGLEHILYRCPHCGTEFEMYTKGTHIWCEHCGKKWEMTTLGQLKATEGETEFAHIPDWFNWERQTVREEVRNCTYRFEDEVSVHTLPNAKRFYNQGFGKLVQTPQGTVVECTAYGKPFKLELAGIELESMHVEYDYPFLKKRYRKNCFGDCVDISTADDSFWLHPMNKRTQLTKLSFATEEIHFLAQEQIEQGKK